MRNLFPPCYHLITRLKISPFGRNDNKSGRDDSKSGISHVLNYKFAVLSNISNICRILGVCVLLIQTPDAYSYEAALEADIDARAEYNDNIHIQTLTTNHFVVIK